MPVTLQSNALLTIAEARDFLGMSSSDDEKIAAWIESASDFCQEFWGHTILETEFEQLRMRSVRSRDLPVPVFPIDVESKITITFDGTIQTVWKTSADGARADKDIVVMSDPGLAGSIWAPNLLYRRNGWFCASDPEPIVVTYTGGLAVAPKNLKHAVKLLVQTFMRHQDKQLADVVQFGSGPVSPGIGFGQAYSLMPKWAQIEIESYRVPRV